jgi:hypothetical protein
MLPVLNNSKIHAAMMKSVIRIATLATLMCVAFFGLFCEPLETTSNWFLMFMLSKGIAVAAIVAICRLYPEWVQTDKFIAAYNRWCNKDVDL